ncbi:MAG TPA: CHAP domain-containing protein [Ktedonobacteraceae bacterium]
MFFAKRPPVTTSQDKTPDHFPERKADTALLVPAPTTVKLTAPLSMSTTLNGGPISFAGSTQNRVPIVIKREIKRPVPPAPRSREARRHHSKRLWVLGMAMLFITLAGTLLGLTPQGREITAHFDPDQAKIHNTMVKNQQNNAAQVSALATTTWMYQNDGIDPYSHGQVNVYDGKTSRLWPYGQCTYWANYRYHQLSSHWVQWSGNADQWFLGAQKADWDYGQMPPPLGVPSIVVLMPYVQGAGWLGHVAVVESQTGNIVHTSNMNWGYGGSTHVEYVDFTIGSGVYFVWHKPTN